MTTVSTPVTARRSLWFLAVLSVLLGFASISTDLYLPTPPDDGRRARGERRCAAVDDLRIPVRLCPRAAVLCPVSDRYGRRVPVALGVLVF